MDMRMVQQFLIQVCSTLKKPISAPRCLLSRATVSSVSALARKQQAVDLALVLQGQWRQLAGQREHHMRIADRQQIAAARLQPAVAGVGLALRTTAVPARVI